MIPVRADPTTQAELGIAAAQIVIDRIAQQAAENEHPLTEEEKQRLALIPGPETDPFFEGRMLVFLHRIVEREQSRTGHLDVELKLKDVLRYAGADRSYAIELARYVVSQPKPPARPRRWLIDKAALVFWVVLGFVALFGVFFVLSVMGILR